MNSELVVNDNKFLIQQRSMRADHCWSREGAFSVHNINVAGAGVSAWVYSYVCARACAVCVFAPARVVGGWAGG